jgi:hypothetical protein
MQSHVCKCGRRFTQRPHATTGKLAPITDYTTADGNIEIETNGAYRIVSKADRDASPGPRYLNHFVDCPLASEFGRRRG